MTLQRLLSFAALTASITSVCSGQRIIVQVDGKEATFSDAQPQMIHGLVYVPIRGVFEQMGATIDWDASQGMVSGKRGSHTLLMRPQGHSVMVDNRSVHLDARAQMVGGSVMVPLRFVSAALGSDIEWNPITRTANILSADGHFMSNSVRPYKDHGKKDSG